MNSQRLGIVQLARPWWCLDSSVIRWALPQSRFCWSLACHCVVLDGEYAIHAVFGKGVVRERADKVLGRYSSKFVCYYHVPSQDDGIEWARSQVGKPYDLEGALGLALYPLRDWQKDDSWFCFEFAAATLKWSGLDVFHGTGHITSSALFSIKHEAA